MDSVAQDKPASEPTLRVRPVINVASLLRIPFAVVLIALALRLAIYAYSLPYVENVDEVNMYLLANDWRGKLDATWRNHWLAGYPPAYIWMSGAVMDVMDRLHPLNIHTDMAVYIRALRLLALSADLITLAALMMTARLLNGSSAALLAGLIWSVSAPVTFNAVAALPDSHALMFGALSVLCSVASIRFDRAWLALAGTIAGLLAVVFKYPLFPILVMPALGCLVLVRRHRRRGMALAGVALALMLATAYGLLVIYGAQGLNNREAETVRFALLTNLLTPSRWVNALVALTQLAGIALPVGAALLVVYIRRERLAHHWLTLSLLITGALLFAVVPGFTRSDTIYATRYTWPASLLLVTASSVLIARAISSDRRALLLGALAVGWMVPPAIAQTGDLRRTDTRAVAQQWFEVNAVDPAGIWTESYGMFHALSRYEAGFSGYKTLLPVLGPEIRQAAPTWFDYVLLDGTDRQRWPARKTLPPLERFTLLKHIGDQGLRGPDIYVYSTELPPDQQPIVFSAGETRLALRRAAVTHSPDQISVDSLWQSLGEQPGRDYSYFIHLTPADNRATIIAQYDATLSQNRPTSSWDDPDESLVIELGPLALANLQPGDYKVWFGVYYWETGERLTLEDGQNSLELARFTL